MWGNGPLQRGKQSVRRNCISWTVGVHIGVLCLISNLSFLVTGWRFLEDLIAVFQALHLLEDLGRLQNAAELGAWMNSLLGLLSAAPSACELLRSSR